MIPTMTIETPPSPPRRHAYYTTPITKVTSLEDFLALTSQTLNIQSPLPPKEESITQPWPFEVAKDKEPSQDNLAFSKQPRCIEGGKYVVRKQEILIPTAKRQYESPKKRESGGEKIFKQHKAQFGYKRVDYTKSLLNTDVYEATDRDIKFLSELNKEILNGCPEVTSSQFEKIVEAWEHQTQENPPIPLDQALLFATGSIDVTIEDTPTLTKIYEYWKESRDHYRRPLLRKYWKAANTELANPNIAFQRRLENRFSRRRSQRMSSPQDDLKRMKTLKKNMNTSLLLMANVRYKEMLKRDLHQAKMKIFEEQLKEELGKDLEASVEGELQIPPPTFDLGLDQTSYCEEKRKMQEYMKKGEVMLKSLKRIKQGALTPTKKTFKKHSINSVDTSSSILQEELPPVIFRPMPFGLTKLTNYLPRNIQGSFTLPMKKCSIELNDLKEKLKQSLGGLYKKDQEELQVKVDVEDSIDEPPKEQEDSPKSASDLCEELVIRIQMEEHTVKQEEGEVAEAPATTVKYNIKFNEKYPNKSPSLDMASKGSLKLGVSFQIKGNFNVPPIDTSKFLSKELVKPIIKSKEGLSAGKNASGEGDIHV